MFSRLRLRRLAVGHTLRYVPVERTLLWESPVMLTPYGGRDAIDRTKLRDFLDGQHLASGLPREAIDCGAVILTGTALLRRNARAITEELARGSGEFVCATAGHDLEARLAAAGSGAIASSRSGEGAVLNVDVGGGTTKFALCVDGDVVDTAAVLVGSRLLAFDGDRHLTRIEDAAHVILRERCHELAIGARLDVSVEELAVERMCALVAAIVGGRSHQLRPELTVLEPTRWPWQASAIRFSGGVSEYLYGADDAAVGDVGWRLGRALREAAAEGSLGPGRVLPRGAGIRATVIGAAQFSVQVSGDTTTIAEGQLPIRNVRVLRVRPTGTGAVSVSEAVSSALRQRVADEPFALAIAWDAPADHASTRALADGIVRGVGDGLAAGAPLVVALDGDLALTLGRILRDETATTAPVVCIDGLRLDDFDFIDIGEPLERRGAVPVVIKSLVFPSDVPNSDDPE